MKTLPYGEGVYRRRIRLTASPGAVKAELEDDFHHFAATLHHDGKHATRVVGEAIRYPWTTCPGATLRLEALAGLPLSTRLTDPLTAHNSREHCTHLFDLACLALAHAAAGRERRQYDIESPDRTAEGRTTLRLLRDGSELLFWQIEGRQILGPAPFVARSLGRGFPQWAEANLDADLAEAAIVLRRASSISMGRSFPLDRIPNANDMRHRTLGACYSFSPEVIELGKRVVGSTWEFTGAPDRLLADEA